MENDYRVPKIRFSGFTDAWKQCELNELVKEVSYKTKKEDEYPLLSSTNSGMEYRSGRVSGTSNIGYKILSTNNLVLSPQNLWLGNINVNDLEVGIVSPSYKTFEFVNVKPEYFKQILRQQKMMDLYNNASLTGASVVRKSLDLNVLLSSIITLPNNDEQTKIGEFFKTIDDLIAFQQCKLSELTDFKKVMLNKMFVKNGEQFPELRFAGFTDAWEQREFSCLVTRISKTSEEENLPRVEYEDVLAGEGRLNKNIFDKISSKKGIEFNENDILFGKLRPYLKNWLHSDFKGLAVGDWWVLRSNKCDSKFIYSLIQTEDFQTIANLSTGTKMPRSDWSVVSKSMFSSPTDIDEQTKIGEFFKTIDDLIACYQRELEEIKKIKTNMLKSMFI